MSNKLALTSDNLKNLQSEIKRLREAEKLARSEYRILLNMHVDLIFKSAQLRGGEEVGGPIPPRATGETGDAAASVMLELRQECTRLRKERDYWKNKAQVLQEDRIDEIALGKDEK